MWQKIKGWLIAFFVGIGSALAAILIWNNRDRYGKSQGTDPGIDASQRDIREAIGRQGSEIAGSIERVERIENVIGDTGSSKQESDDAIRQSQSIRERAQEFLREHKD